MTKTMYMYSNGMRTVVAVEKPTDASSEIHVIPGSDDYAAEPAVVFWLRNWEVCDLLKQPMLPLRIEWYVTVLDLGPWGAVYTQGWERTVASVGAAAKRTSKPSTASGFIRRSPKIHAKSLMLQNRSFKLPPNSAIK